MEFCQILWFTHYFNGAYEQIITLRRIIIQSFMRLFLYIVIPHDPFQGIDADESWNIPIVRDPLKGDLLSKLHGRKSSENDPLTVMNDSCRDSKEFSCHCHIGVTLSSNANRFNPDRNHASKQSNLEFLSVASNILRTNYDGDSIGLLPFINSIELLERIVDIDNVDILRLFVVSKLAGRAYDVTAHNTNTITDIKNSLLQSIKYDNPELVLSKMVALPRGKMSI